MNQVVEVSVDDLGRILIPAPLQKRLGLSLGMTLVVEKGDNGDLCLRPQLASPVLVDKGGVLVVRSEPLGDLSDITRQERERRLSDSDRLLLETHYGHALTPEECASLMSISRDAFHQRVHRARVRLSELLNAGGRAQ